MTRSLLDLPPRLRAVFFCAYLLAQLAVLLHAQWSPDFVFGFQMFNASSDLRITLFRKVRRKGRVRYVKVRDGAWQFTDQTGNVLSYRWQDRVHDGALSNLERYVHASYGLDAQLFRLRFALRDALEHVPGDRQTESLLAVVDTLKNGREAGQVRIEEDRP